MKNDVRTAIECWANRPTWFSSHPSDAQEFRRAVSNLKKISPAPSFEEIKDAILFYVEDAPAMLGTPANIHQTAHDFAAKIYGKL